MDISKTAPEHGSRYIALEGEYDISRKKEVDSLFASLSPNGPLTIGLAKVSYIDSTFLHSLAQLHFRFKEHRITLAGANVAIRRLLSIVKFDRLFYITSDQPKADDASGIQL